MPLPNKSHFRNREKGILYPKLNILATEKKYLALLSPLFLGCTIKMIWMKLPQLLQSCLTSSKFCSGSKLNAAYPPPPGNFTVCNKYTITLNSISSIHISDGATQMHKLHCCFWAKHKQSKLNTETLCKIEQLWKSLSRKWNVLQFCFASGLDDYWSPSCAGEQFNWKKSGKS